MWSVRCAVVGAVALGLALGCASEPPPPVEAPVAVTVAPDPPATRAVVPSEPAEAQGDGARATLCIDSTAARLVSLATPLDELVVQTAPAGAESLDDASGALEQFAVVLPLGGSERRWNLLVGRAPSGTAEAIADRALHHRADGDHVALGTAGAVASFALADPEPLARLLDCDGAALRLRTTEVAIAETETGGALRLRADLVVQPILTGTDVQVDLQAHFATELEAEEGERRFEPALERARRALFLSSFLRNLQLSRSGTVVSLRGPMSASGARMLIAFTAGWLQRPAAAAGNAPTP